MGSSKRYLPRAIRTWDIYNSLEKKYKCYKNTITADYIMGDIMKRMLVVIAIALLIVVSNTADAISINKDVNDSIKLEQNYKLRLVSIDMSGPVRSAVLDLIPGEKKTVLSGENFSLYRGETLVLKGRLDTVFVGALAELVQIKDLVQYDEDGIIILTMEEVLLSKPYHPPVKITPASETVKLKQGYDLVLMAADDMSTPQQIWLQLSRNGNSTDDRVVALDESFSMYDGSALIVTSTFDPIFSGSESLMVRLTGLSQYNRNTGALMLYLDRVMMELPYS
jgi:hypothetical protein